MVSIKASRAFTGRPMIAKVEGAYHGGYDYAEVSQAPKPETWGSVDHPNSVPLAHGTPESALNDVLILPFNDIERALAILNEHADDIAGVLDLVRPLEEAGVLVRRSRELFEQEITNFTVLERDGRVLACAAMYPFAGSQTAEIACIATHPDYRDGGRGMHLLELLTAQAKDQGIRQLFVLTTQTTHWFIEQGFVNASLDQLPTERQALYNLQRNSKVLIKNLD